MRTRRRQAGSGYGGALVGCHNSAQKTTERESGSLVHLNFTRVWEALCDYFGLGAEAVLTHTSLQATAEESIELRRTTVPAARASSRRRWPAVRVTADRHTPQRDQQRVTQHPAVCCHGGDCFGAAVSAGGMSTLRPPKYHLLRSVLRYDAAWSVLMRTGRQLGQADKHDGRLQG